MSGRGVTLENIAFHHGGTAAGKYSHAEQVGWLDSAGQVSGKWHNRCVKSDTEIKQTVIAILTSVRDGEVSSEAEQSAVQSPAGAKGLFEHAYTPPASAAPDSPAGLGAPAISAAPQAAEQARRQALTAATYAMTLFHMLAAEFEAACPDVDVQAFLRRRALEAAADDEEAA
jgi:hypothetical protein